MLFIAGSWLWHLPALYDLALRNDLVHDYLEHNTFLLIGIIFWLQVIPSAPLRPLLPYLARIAYLLAAVIQNVALSLYLGFSPKALYTPYALLASRPGGISALTDQKIGAAIMWAVGDLPFVVAIIGIIQVWLWSEFQRGDNGEGSIAFTSKTPVQREA